MLRLQLSAKLDLVYNTTLAQFNNDAHVGSYILSWFLWALLLVLEWLPRIVPIVAVGSGVCRCICFYWCCFMANKPYAAVPELICLLKHAGFLHFSHVPCHNVYTEHSFMRALLTHSNLRVPPEIVVWINYTFDDNF